MSDREAAREARRAMRLDMLDEICRLNIQAAQRLTKYINGCLSESQSDPFSRLADPFLALTRLTRAIRQTALLQERLGEDEKTRDQRLKAEQEAREAAETPVAGFEAGRGDCAAGSVQPRAAANGHDPP